MVGSHVLLGILAWAFFIGALSLMWITVNAGSFYSRYARWCRACNITPPAQSVAFWLNFAASAIALIAALFFAAMYLAAS